MAASGNVFLRLVKLFVVVSLLTLPFSPNIRAQQGQAPGAGTRYVVQRIEILGNRRVQRDTLLARMFLRQGDPYSDEAVRRDFQALWNTQFFEDIRVEVEDSPDLPNGKIIIYHVQERPIIRRIEYKGNKSITESDILDAYKDK